MTLEFNSQRAIWIPSFRGPVVGLCPTSTDSVLAAGYGSHLPGEGYREPLLGPENTQKATALEFMASER